MRITEFPHWVVKTKGKQPQATARLRYMLCRLCLEVTGKVSFREMHAKTGLCDHSTIAHYIRKGQFSQKLADAFEEYFGADVVTADMLVAPLEIKSN